MRCIFFTLILQIVTMIECREIVDSVKAEHKLESQSQVECEECNQLQLEFKKNPGGLPPKNLGIILAAVTGICPDHSPHVLREIYH